MAYKPRISADSIYLQTLGQAFYNFTYLEWVVVWTIVKLSPNGFKDVPKGESASIIAKALTKAIQDADPPLSKNLRSQLVHFDRNYRAGIKIRNKLLHGHPYSAENGEQQIGGGGYEWSIDVLNDAAKLFEDAAITGNDTFHGDLKRERP